MRPELRRWFQHRQFVKMLRRFASGFRGGDGMARFSARPAWASLQSNSKGQHLVHRLSELIWDVETNTFRRNRVMFHCNVLRHLLIKVSVVLRNEMDTGAGY